MATRSLEIEQTIIIFSIEPVTIAALQEFTKEISVSRKGHNQLMNDTKMSNEPYC